ncbi:hypothetical protein ACFLQN_02490, partial [Candidatus Aenigmatarchaeota archaeon]
MVKKGYVYTLEVLIALSLIFLTLVFVFKTPIIQTEVEVAVIKRIVMDEINHLGETGELASYA